VTGFVELPADVPLDHELPGSPNAPDPAQAAAQPAPTTASRFWTDDEKKQLVQIFRTAKTPEEIVERSTALGHDAGIHVPLEGPGGANWIMQFRQQNRGAVPMTFSVPDFAKGAQPPKPEDQPPPDDYMVLPADAKIDLGTVSGLSPEEIKRRYESNPHAEALRRAAEAGTQPLGLTPLAQHGFTAGLDTDIKAGTNAALEFLLHPIDAIQSRGENVGDAYNQQREESLARIDYLRQLHPYTAPIEEIGGAVANPVGMEARGVKALAGVGAAYGGISGFENSNGTIGERALEGIKGAGIGLVAAPVATALLRAPGAAVQAGRTVLGGSPDLARRIISKAIEADGKTSAEVGTEMGAAHANAVPYMLADTGDNARGLLAASVRTPGPARTLARNALEERQAGLGERVTNAIERDLGPVANPHEVADQLMTRASRTAGPLYDAAYSRPGADTFGRAVAPLLGRPSMKRAFASAYRIAQEEGRDPTSLGFDLDAAGEPTLTRVPSWQTMDYVKRGMDDVVESYRDPTSGRLNLNTEGRAINGTLRTFLGAFDKANPDYAAARAAYGGPVRGIDAMNQGRKALNMTADDLEARMRDMTPFEKDMFALGTRRAMAEAVQSKGDTANVINTLVGTGKKRAMLGRLFGDRKQFGRFVDTLSQEKEGFRTFARGTTGSPTALNGQDDAALEVASAAIDMAANGGMPIATAIKMAMKFGAGRRGAETKQKVAALLSETDPARFRDLAESIRVEMERRGLRSRRINRAATAITRDLLTPTGQPAQQGQ
jgi:hypothetical protein